MEIIVISVSDCGFRLNNRKERDSCFDAAYLLLTKQKEKKKNVMSTFLLLMCQHEI